MTTASSIMRFAKHALQGSLTDLGKEDSSYAHAKQESKAAYAFAVSNVCDAFYGLSVERKWIACAPGASRRLLPLKVWQRALQKWGADFLKETKDAT